MTKFVEIRLHDNIYRIFVTVIVCSDVAEWDKWLDSVYYDGDRLDHTGSLASYYRLTHENTKGKNDNHVIFLRKQNVSSLAHEAVHLVMRTFHDRGVVIGLENDEAFAYYVEYWINSVRDEWSELRRSERSVNVEAKKTKV